MNTVRAKLSLIGVSLIILGFQLTAQGDAIDPKSVVAMWLFDDVKGDSVKDASKNGHDGKIDGAELVDGKIGKALSFDGVDDLVDCGMEEYDFGDNFSVVLWLQHIGGDYRAVINNGYTEAPFDIRFGREDAGTRLYAIMRTTERADRFLLQMLVEPNEWHHIALVYDGETVDFYLDGSSEANGKLAGNINVVSAPVIIGHNENNEWYSGLLDEVAIFNAALNQNDIQTIMNKGLEKALTVDLSGKLAITWANIKSH
jgi:hypothetical protein